MVSETEGTFKIGDKDLYTKTWLPDGPPVAKLVFFHGYSDHVGRYYGFFPALAARGIAVYGIDQRGWGRSVAKPAERGLTGPTPQVLAEMVAFIDHAAQPTDKLPLFVMGHSMGGGQVLTLACSAAPEHGQLAARVRGWLVEAPFVGFAPELAPSALKVVLGRVAGHLLPRHQMVERVPPENLSRDPEVVRSISEDKLMHNTGTLEGLAGMLDRTEALSKGRVRPEVGKVRALWMGHGTADKGTSFEASRKWYDECCGEVEDREFKAYEGAYHQLHADFGKEEFYKDVGDWILARVGTRDEVAQTTTGDTAKANQAKVNGAKKAEEETKKADAPAEAKL